MSNALHLQSATSVETFTTRAALKIPHLWLDGGYFYCDGQPLYLRSARNKCLLMQEFLHAPDHSLQIEEIIQVIHGTTGTVSPRLQESLHKNVHRMLADTRSLLQKRYSQHKQLEWLPYSRLDKAWCLYRFSDWYVLDQLFSRVSSAAVQS